MVRPRGVAVATVFDLSSMSDPRSDILRACLFVAAKHEPTDSSTLKLSIRYASLGGYGWSWIAS
jgi:hypothetical protein